MWKFRAWMIILDIAAWAVEALIFYMPRHGHHS